MRDRDEIGLADKAGDDAERSITRRAASAVGHRDEARLERAQLLGDQPEERLLGFVCAGREELEAKGALPRIDPIFEHHLGGTVAGRYRSAIARKVSFDHILLSAALHARFLSSASPLCAALG